jgi:metal-responsive CopG/Arc/MetJ family transcriptional regulator
MQKKREKLQKDLVIRVQPSLFKKFQKRCTDDYKSISQAIRDLMRQYITEKDTNDNKNGI